MKIAAVIIICIGICGLVISCMTAVRGSLVSRVKALNKQKISIAVKMDEIEVRDYIASNDGWETATTLIYDATEPLDNGTERL